MDVDHKAFVRLLGRLDQTVAELESVITLPLCDESLADTVAALDDLHNQRARVEALIRDYHKAHRRQL
jgi:hypothetical protein